MLRRLTAGRARLMAGAFTVLVIVICARFRAWGEHQGAAPKDSAEMRRIFDADQADRQVNIAAMTRQQLLDWLNKVGPRDAQRRKQVRDLMARGALQTGHDFDEAAFVFQHGDNPNDYLLAHTLAIVAVTKGSSKSRWIAAATLDRYLQAVKEPQIFGTQYRKPDRSDKFTQEPYNRQLVPDALRLDMCVSAQASQQHKVDLLNQGKEPPEEKIPGC
jgi:hypothetical protein